MTALARVSAAPQPDPVAVLIARCEARALLWKVGEISLHDAVDELQSAAGASGLIADIGQDEVQRLMATAFAPVRDDLPKSEDMVPDEIEVPPGPRRIAASTLMAAEYLVRAGDPKELQHWLAQHGADERKAIQKHLGGKHAAKPRAD